MFNIFFSFYKKNLKYDLINKFNYLLFKLPKINNVTLSFELKIFNLKTIAVHFLILQYLSNMKTGLFIKTKKPNLLLKIKKGDPIGCQFFLKQNKFIFLLFKKLTLEILLITKTNKKQISNNFFLFVINEITLIPKFEKFFNIFSIANKSKLKISINFNVKKKEISYILKNLKIILMLV